MRALKGEGVAGNEGEDEGEGCGSDLGNWTVRERLDMYDMIPGTLNYSLPYDTCHLPRAKASQTKAQRQVTTLLGRRALPASAVEHCVQPTQGCMSNTRPGLRAQLQRICIVSSYFRTRDPESSPSDVSHSFSLFMDRAPDSNQAVYNQAVDVEMGIYPYTSTALRELHATTPQLARQASVRYNMYSTGTVRRRGRCGPGTPVHRYTVGLCLQL